MSADFTGLSLIAPTGVAWQWVGYSGVTNRHGVLVRVERWEAPCRACGEAFIVLAKLPGGLKQRFLERRNRAHEALEVVDVRLVVPDARPIKAFQLRNCKQHRGWGVPRPEDLV